MERWIVWRGWRNGRWAAGGIAAAAALGAAIVLWMTAHWGVGADSDGLAYLILARQVAARQEYGYPLPGGGVKPMTHFPPGYPLTVAAMHLLTGGSMANAALVLSILAFATLIALAGWLTFRHTRHFWPAVGVAAWLAVAPGLLYIYGWARSETVFITLLLLLGALLTRWEEHPSPAGALAIGLLAGWITYVRWVGVIAAAWVLLWMGWVNRRQSLARGWRCPIVTALGAGVPVGALLLANRLRAGSATNRRILWHPPTAAQWQQALQTVGDWLCPACHLGARGETLLGGLMVLGGLMLVALAWHRAARQGKASVWRVFVARWGSFAGLYFGALVGAITVVDAATPLDKRLLAPLLPVLTMVLAVTVWRLLHERPMAATVVSALWLAFLAFTLWGDYHAFYDMRWGGVAVRSFRWQQAKIWEAVRSLPPDVLVLTNDMEGTVYYTGRPVHLLDVPVMKNGRLYHYDASLNEMQPLPYRDMQTWGLALARSLEGRCVAVVYVTLKQPDNPALEQAFEVVARFRSGLLLAPPGGEACLSRERGNR